MKEKRLRGLWKNKEKRERESQGKDPRTFDGNSQGGDSSTFKAPVERWRVLRKRKEKKWRKKKKRWVEKDERKVCTFFAATLRKRRRAERVKNVPGRDKSWASREDCYFSLCLWHRIGCVLTLQQNDCRRGRR